MKPAPRKYRTTNWKAYNAALKARGSLLIWLDPTMNWHGQASGKRGRSTTFSDEAIQFCLSIKCLFNLPLRQAMGMTDSLPRPAGLDWPVSDYSTVSRRQWRKVHLDIDAVTLEIRAMEVTDNSIGDAPMLPDLPGQIPLEEQIARVSGDGAYDTKTCHEAIALHEADAIIPTRKNARPRKMNRPGAEARNEILRTTRRLGRTICKKWSGYHRRSVVETKMRRFKLLGERIMARDFDHQVAELQMRAAVLNRFTRPGTPITVAMR
jgi:hypothetical protein